jgi:hypothetical protein
MNQKRLGTTDVEISAEEEVWTYERRSNTRMEETK